LFISSYVGTSFLLVSNILFSTLAEQAVSSNNVSELYFLWSLNFSHNKGYSFHGFIQSPQAYFTRLTWTQPQPLPSTPFSCYWTNIYLQHLRLPPHCRWTPQSYVMLHGAAL
jgi:hypothetical protein